jgi:acetate kinase
MPPVVLALNAGSSSLKYALYSAGEKLTRIAAQKLESDPPKERAEVALTLAAMHTAQGWPLEAVGHRIVHGGPRFLAPTKVTSDLVRELKKISPYDPQHLPAQIELIETCAARFPSVPQVACFDTAFHRDLPRVSRILPIPRKYEAEGIRRYGFHGLSYQYVVRELGLNAGGKAVIAHLGNGASVAAVNKGKCVDTTMAFTPAAGIPMSRRSGDLDPGLIDYLAKTEGMTPDRFQKMVNTESGLLGISETSSDVRDLLEKEKSDSRAAEALAVFCYSVKKTIGAYAAALGGIETLVFAGGIGENSSVIRERVCDGLGFLGVELDPDWNAANKPIISKGPVTVRVIKTDEELEIARSTWEVLRNEGRR